MMHSVNPFDWRTVLLAKHAQHVVLIHFPIALYLVAVGADLFARVTKRSGLADFSYWNLTLAAIFTLPVVATGLFAWQWQLEGQKLKSLLLYHLVSALTTTVFIWLTWWLYFRARHKGTGVLPAWGLPFEIVGAVLIILTAHLGGFLSGVNGTP